MIGVMRCQGLGGGRYEGDYFGRSPFLVHPALNKNGSSCANRSVLPRTDSPKLSASRCSGLSMADLQRVLGSHA